jgi:plasmid stabilization system protein ParE
MRIEYEDDAKLDLIEIGDHYRDAGGRALALRMVRGTRAEVAVLADNPNIAPAYELAPGLRRLVVAKGAYLVFFRVNSQHNARVEVVHIRRAEREPYSTEAPDTQR